MDRGGHHTRSEGEKNAGAKEKEEIRGCQDVVHVCVLRRKDFQRKHGIK